MAKELRPKGAGDPRTKATAGSKAQGSGQPPGEGSQGPGSTVWVREDGAFCVGDECIVMQHKTDRFEITVDPTRCGPAGVDLLKQLSQAFAYGLPTHYVVKPTIESKET